MPRSTTSGPASPFAYRAWIPNNGSEFIHDPLFQDGATRAIQVTRGRPYKKDDNAHIEQKNWTHVRRLLGWDRYDSPAALAAMNDLYRHELRLMMNLFQPSVTLQRKTRVGSRLRRVYDRPPPPLDRFLTAPDTDRAALQALQDLRARLDPFVLAATDRAETAAYLQPRASRPRPRRSPPLPHHRFEIRR